jgi:hypothetical protein
MLLRRYSWGVAKTWCFPKFHRSGLQYKQPACDKSPRIKSKYQSMISGMVAMQAGAYTRPLSA